ncbi:MAG TPA: hypothetical protein VMI33_22315 [Streptosporangiaceae bacterium]|nr:hypothetical protein [Streptosporangiaceae bacterium]
MLCFATFVGGWKEIQPRQAIVLKRRLDETMYANKVPFSDQLLANYHQFMTTLTRRIDTRIRKGYQPSAGLADRVTNCVTIGTFVLGLQRTRANKLSRSGATWAQCENLRTWLRDEEAAGSVSASTSQ